MSNIISRFFGKDPDSAYVAKERLQMVLVHDRANISHSAIEQLKDDLIQTIARHIDIDASKVRIEIESAGRQQRLIADIPLKKSSRKHR